MGRSGHFHHSGQFKHSGNFNAKSTVIHRPFVTNSVFPQPISPWLFWPPVGRFVDNRFVDGRVFDGRFGFGNGFTTGFVGGAPTVVVTTPGYGDPVNASLTYGPGPSAATPAPAPFPTASLIDYSTGWYQLRGDGITSAYQWVWIPKPPIAPVAAPEPPAPPRAPESAQAPAAEPPARGDRGPAYHWTDDRGVETWTNRLDRVPKRFRDQAAASSKSE